MGLKFIKLLKTHVEKMSAFRLSMIFMKTNELGHSFQDVDEKKGSYRNCTKLELEDVQARTNGTALRVACLEAYTAATLRSWCRVGQ